MLTLCMKLSVNIDVFFPILVKTHHKDTFNKSINTLKFFCLFSPISLRCNMFYWLKISICLSENNSFTIIQIRCICCYIASIFRNKIEWNSCLIKCINVRTYVILKCIQNLYIFSCLTTLNKVRHINCRTHT